jgi:AGCS family alanine or glycine:cation symporter
VVGAGAGGLSTDVEPGPGYIQQALDSVFPGAGPTFIALALAFFVFTTIVAYYYMAEVNLKYLTRKMKNRTVARALLRVLQALVLVSVAYGAVTSAGAAWGLGDIGVGSMAWINIVGILVLQGPALKALKDYREQKKQGLDPQFDPRKLGIEGATFWELRADGHQLQGRTGDELPPEQLGIDARK